MIGWLCGTVVDKTEPGKLVLDVNGVGYDVETSLTTFFKLESESRAISLHIHTVVREDAFLLYGFADKAERALFRTLLKVNGIGPKVAIHILSSITPDALITCIQNQDTIALTRLPGIGKKTAERMVVELKGCLPTAVTLSLEGVVTGKSTARDEAIQALEALGYKSQEAFNAISQVENGGELDRDALIRLALRALAKVF
jgi:Holliday junction DNA helicase RuvA